MTKTLIIVLESFCLCLAILLATPVPVFVEF